MRASVRQSAPRQRNHIWLDTLVLYSAPQQRRSSHDMPSTTLRPPSIHQLPVHHPAF